MPGNIRPPGAGRRAAGTPGLPQVVTATQVYEYVDDIPAALTEACRALRPGSRLLVLDTDWESIIWRSSDADRMRKVLAAWDEHLTDPHLPRRLAELLSQTGFTVTHRLAIPLFNAGYDTGTFSAGLIGVIAAFVPGRGRDRCRCERLGGGSGQARRRILLRPQPVPLPRL